MENHKPNIERNHNLEIDIQKKEIELQAAEEAHNDNDDFDGESTGLLQQAKEKDKLKIELLKAELAELKVNRVDIPESLDPRDASTLINELSEANRELENHKGSRQYINSNEAELQEQSRLKAEEVQDRIETEFSRRADNN